MKHFILLVLAALSFNANALEISTADVGFDCFRGKDFMTVDLHFLRMRAGKTDLLATVGTPHPLFTGTEIGKASIEKSKDGLILKTDIMLIAPWEVSDYWDIATFVFNDTTKQIKYTIQSGYSDNEVIYEGVAQCGEFYFHPTLEAAIKKL